MTFGLTAFVGIIQVGFPTTFLVVVWRLFVTFNIDNKIPENLWSDLGAEF